LLLASGSWASPFSLAPHPHLPNPVGPECPSVLRLRATTPFIGTLVAHALESRQAPESWDFAVERVFAGADRPVTSPILIAVRRGRVTHFEERCYPPTHLHIGQRYLVSTQALGEFSSMYTVLWALDANDHIASCASMALGVSTHASPQ
jgi:hypothetical protein